MASCVLLAPASHDGTRPAACSTAARMISVLFDIHGGRFTRWCRPPMQLVPSAHAPVDEFAQRRVVDATVFEHGRNGATMLPVKEQRRVMSYPQSETVKMNSTNRDGVRAVVCDQQCLQTLFLSKMLLINDKMTNI